MTKTLKLIFLLFFAVVCFFVLTRANFAQSSEKVSKKAKLVKQGEKKELTEEEKQEAINKMFEEKRQKVYLPAVEENIEILEKGFKEKTLGYGMEYTILALSRANDPRAVPILTKILLEYDLKDEGTPHKAPSSEVREAAAEALGSIGDESAIPALKEALKDEDKEVVLASIGSLGRIGTGEARNILKKIEFSGDKEKAVSIANALIWAGDVDDGLLRLRDLKTTGYLIQFIRQGIITYEKAKELTLYVVEKGETEESKVLAACILSEFGDKRDKEIAFNVAIEHLYSENGRVRSSALTCLKNIGSKRAIPYIEKFLKIDFNDFTYLENTARMILEKLYEKE